VIGLLIGVAIAYPLGRNAAVLPPGRAPDPLPKTKHQAFNQAFGHVDLSDPATVAGRVGDIVTGHGPVDTRRDENGQTALMLTHFTMVFPQTVELRCEPVQCVACPRIALRKANTLQSPLQIQDFRQAILEQRSPLLSGAVGRTVVALFTAIYRSQREHRPIPFPLAAAE